MEQNKKTLVSSDTLVNARVTDETPIERNITMLLGPHDRPKSIGKWIILSLQHVFAMFGATVLVPIVINQTANTEVINISMALFCSGIGTLIYIAFTGAKVPIYLGSSFSYMTVVGMSYPIWGNAIFIAIFLIGVVYIIAGFVIYWTGINWVKKIFSPVVIGPIITIIGLSAISSALRNIGFIWDGDTTGNIAGATEHYPRYLAIIIGLAVFLVAGICMLKAKSFMKTIPILIALAFGYVLTIILHFSLQHYGVVLMDTTKITDTSAWEWYPNFKAFWHIKASNIAPAIVSIVPISIVTMIEHLGDHINVGVLSGKDYIKDPGIHRTLIADGVSLLFDGLVGGPANTTYAENTSVVSITKVASVWVTGLAACFAVLMSFIAPINQIIQMIPAPVLGGISLLLFGMISINGVRLMIDNKVDLLDARNMLICAAVLAIGVGMSVTNSTIDINGFQLTGLFLATVIGIVLNLALPHHDNAGIKTMFYWMKNIKLGRKKRPLKQKDHKINDNEKNAN